MLEKLRTHFNKIQSRPIISLFDTHDRARAFSVRFGDILFDYAKTNLDEIARSMLLNLFETRKVAQKRSAMFAGEKINETEGRAVLHIALRNKSKNPIYVDGQDIMTKVINNLDSMKRFTDDVRFFSNIEVRQFLLDQDWFGQYIELFGAAYCDFGRVWPDVGDVSLGGMHWSRGAALRLSWDRDLLMRVALGWSAEQVGIFFDWGNSF